MTAINSIFIAIFLLIAALDQSSPFPLAENGEGEHKSFAKPKIWQTNLCVRSASKSFFDFAFFSSFLQTLFEFLGAALEGISRW